MAFNISWEKTYPCFADEADCQRGAKAYAAECARSGMSPERLRAADLSRGTDSITDPVAMMVLELAQRKADDAIRESWEDKSGDTLVRFYIDI